MPIVECIWVTDADVLDWLGVEPASVDDEAFVTLCTAAANSWAFRRRLEAGYVDDPEESPNAAVTLGTIMYAGSLFRERGSVDSFASFGEMSTGAPVASMGQIMRLLAIGRPQIA